MTPNLRATAFLLRSLRQESRLVSHHAMEQVRRAANEVGDSIAVPPRTRERLFQR